MNGTPRCLARACQQNERLSAGDPERPAQTLDTRLVVPLLPTGAVGKLNSLLNPTFEIAGQTWFLATQAIGVVRTSRLARRVGSLMADENAVIKAIDRLLLGS